MKYFSAMLLGIAWLAVSLFLTCTIIGIVVVVDSDWLALGRSCFDGATT